MRSDISEAVYSGELVQVTSFITPSCLHQEDKNRFASPVPHDPMGNRLQKNDNITGLENYLYNDANMLLSRNGQGYLNDPNGNTLSGGGRTNTWDSQNRLVESICNGKTTTSVYGADGLRRQSTVDSSAETVTTKYLLDGQSVVQEFIQRFDKSTSQMVESTITYLNGPRGAEYRRVDNDNDGTTDSVRWYIYDGLGSVIGEIGGEDINHNVVKSTCRLDVYEAVRQSSGTSESNHKFVGALGHTSESSTDLIYMRARYYDPVVGRFISQDSARDGDNWFSCCGNNPINLTDFTGCMAGFDDGLNFEAESGGAAVRAGLGAKEKVLKAVQNAIENRLQGLGVKVRRAGLDQLRTSKGFDPSTQFQWNLHSGGRTVNLRLDLSGHGGEDGIGTSRGVAKMRIYHTVTMMILSGGF